MAIKDDIVLVRNLRLFAETDKAILLGACHLKVNSITDLGKEWVPLVFIESPFPFDDIGDVADVEMPRWIADQKDFSYEEVQTY